MAKNRVPFQTHSSHATLEPRRGDASDLESVVSHPTLDGGIRDNQISLRRGHSLIPGHGHTVPRGSEPELLRPNRYCHGGRALHVFAPPKNVFVAGLLPPARPNPSLTPLPDELVLLSHRNRRKGHGGRRGSGDRNRRRRCEHHVLGAAAETWSDKNLRRVSRWPRPLHLARPRTARRR